MYDPSIGRWLQEDPLGFEAGDSNLYRYVTNSPTAETDPSGLQQSAERKRLLDQIRNLENLVKSQQQIVLGWQKTVEGWKQAIDLVRKELIDKNEEIKNAGNRRENYQRQLKNIYAAAERAIRAGCPPGEVEEILKDTRPINDEIHALNRIIIPRLIRERTNLEMSRQSYKRFLDQANFNLWLEQLRLAPFQRELAALQQRLKDLG